MASSSRRCRDDKSLRRKYEDPDFAEYYAKYCGKPKPKPKDQEEVSYSVCQPDPPPVDSTNRGGRTKETFSPSARNGEGVAGVRSTGQKVGQTGKAKSKGPAFPVAMKKSHLTRYSLNIPQWFCKKYLKREKGDAILTVDGKIWQAKFLSFGQAAKTTRLSGWTEFAEDNHLKIGDTCFLELLGGAKDQKVMFKVSIVRNT